MRMYICPFPRMLFAALLLGLPLSAQTARIHNSRAQANLQIDVKVASAIGVHHRDKDDRDDRDKDKDKDKDEDRKNSVVSYNLNPRNEEFSVTEEMRSILVDSGSAVRQEQVRAITVVPK